MNIFDRGSYAVHSTREYDNKGYLKCHARVARSGIQKYYGIELGDSKEPMRVFNVYRPPEVVFADAALADYLNADITNDHPQENVGAENFTRLSKGTVISKGSRDPSAPDYVLCDLLIKDAETIKAVEAGKVEISAGYDADISFTPGVAPDGTPYDAIVKGISLNHVAIVTRGRAGHEARILDNSPTGGKLMDVNIGATKIALTDEAQAAAVMKELASMTAKIKDAEGEAAVAKAKLADADKQMAEKDARIADLEGQLQAAKDACPTDEEIKGMLKDADALRAKAKSLAGDAFVCDSIIADDIKRAAIAASGCKVDLADKSEDYVSAFFDALCERAEDAEPSHKKVADAISEGAKCDEDEEDDEAEEGKRRQSIGDAWKVGLNLK